MLQPHEGTSETLSEWRDWYYGYLLQPHEGTSETPRVRPARCRTRSFNPTRVRLKRFSMNSRVSSESLQPHEGTSETQLMSNYEQEIRNASTPRGYV